MTGLRRLRIVCQLGCLLGFFWLFVATEYRGLDELPYPVSLLFRIDPLAALADFFAPGAFAWQLLWPALLVIVATVLLGRFFCGWICPLGTTLDGAGRLLKSPGGRSRPGLRKIKYLLLLALSAAALFGVQVFGWFDPLSLFLRTLTFSLYPVYNLFANRVFDFFYDHHLPLISDLVNGAYPFWRDHLMAFQQPVFALGLFTALVFLAVLLLEKFERRFWCRNLCPLGALLGLCSRHALVRREPASLCSDCSRCQSACRMAATGSDGHARSECVLCFECTEYCPAERVRFGFHGREGSGQVDLRRREVVTALAVGALVGPTASIAPAAASADSYLLRPPGAVAEDEFLRRCIRCGECLKVCIGRALQPAWLDAGPLGLWTPRLVARFGYCEYNCTLCGQVCPTGAIRPLTLEQKHKTVIGLAVLDKDRCLPYARNEECLVCEEHCPTGRKAIVFEQKQVLVQSRIKILKIPRVVGKLCIGCGICETRCPVEGRSAIRVTNENESRRKRDGLA
ncbi:4Fe-4S ferredoxin [Geothermobacter hydrogeniphilus]|uniref:4Fe-4S ferredoxin n=1 Tax=Geothermobacter hydrogeniphilus TaxID=1969733 RepID=A0A2K2H814_9BACT|nr:4Fe-4S binding protein [Geothermobacter hydrogeniphilus]PNU19373.1 4Fe-4S ferredoxin [Geothermobacter hydrogeniphilus]